MSDVVVRATVESDLPLISDLTERVFGRRRDPALLRWLLENPEAPGQIDSWVAETDGRIVGHTAVLKCRYHMGGGPTESLATGVHAYLWMVDSELRGRAGMKLGTAIVNHSDFHIVVGGSPTTKAILTGRRFAEAGEAKEYRIGRAELPAGDGDGFALAPASAAAPPPAPLPAGVVANEAAPEHLAWLARCPDLESHLFALERDGCYLGPVLLFVNRRVSPAAGRLVHLPYLGDDPEAWSRGLATIARELARLECRSWTLLATHPAMARACDSADSEIVGRRPVWIKERREVLGGAETWHLTYLEGDLAYRRVRHGAPRVLSSR